MNKPIVYSNHAEIVIRERRLEKRWVERTVELPDWSIADPVGLPVERRYKSILEAGGRYLRVVCLESPTEIRIISAFLDRGAKTS